MQSRGAPANRGTDRDLTATFYLLSDRFDMPGLPTCEAGPPPALSSTSSGSTTCLYFKLSSTTLLIPLQSNENVPSGLNAHPASSAGRLHPARTKIP